MNCFICKQPSSNLICNHCPVCAPDLHDANRKAVASYIDDDTITPEMKHYVEVLEKYKDYMRHHFMGITDIVEFSVSKSKVPCKICGDRKLVVLAHEIGLCRAHAGEVLELMRIDEFCNAIKYIENAGA